MPTLLDPEFGEVLLRRSRLARAVRLKLDSRGVISISLPLRTPLWAAKRLLNQTRESLRDSLGNIREQALQYHEGDRIGTSHLLRFEPNEARAYEHQVRHNELIIFTPATPATDQIQRAVHSGIAKAIRVQAKAYLPRQLDYLAQAGGFSYAKLRFSSAGTRWGSCSSRGTISLNIWLMQLPLALIDYVIWHELCHTKVMNHSATFWQLLESHCPQYKQLRRELKTHHPHA